MKKSFFAIFLVFGFLCTSGAGALTMDGGIFKVGPVSDSGTGFGNVLNILTLQNPSFSGATEIGSVGWNGTKDTLTNDAKNTSKTWLISDIMSKGIADASQLGIVYNVNQQGNVGNLTTTLNYFTLQVYNLDGSVVFSTKDKCVGCGSGFIPIAQGTGGAGYLFDLDLDAEVGLNNYFTQANKSLYRLGATGSVSLSNAGPENFYLEKLSGVTPVPEPTTMLLLGAGLIVLAVYGRKKLS